MGKPIWVPDPTNGQKLVDAWEHATRGNAMADWRARQALRLSAREQQHRMIVEHASQASSCGGCGANGTGTCEYCGRPR